MSGTENEQIVRDFIELWNRRDRAAIGRAFHPEIACTGASYPTAHGVAEALALCDPFLAADAIDWQVVNCAVRGATVFTERVDRFKFGDRPWLVVEACGVFELSDDGLIRRWHDYFDTAGLAAAMP